MSYTVHGEFRTGKGEQPFSRTVDAESASHAEDLVLSQLTSEHSISRANITVDDVSEA
jgi:ribosomal protein L20A (L18A)